MADAPRDAEWFSPNCPPTAARQPTPGELVMEFHVPATHTFWRVELRDHGRYGIEAQFLDPTEVRWARTFPAYLDPTRTPRHGHRLGRGTSEMARSGMSLARSRSASLRRPHRLLCRGSRERSADLCFDLFRDRF